MTTHTELETTACPLCGADDPSVMHDFAPYRLVRCGGCGLAYLSPRLEEDAMLALYAQADYYEAGEVGYASYTEQEAALKATFAAFLKRLHQQGLARGRLLEIGCGYGYLLSAARPHVEYLAGTDYAAEAVQRAAPLADAVYEGGLAQVPADERFDLIVHTNVIEHVYDPVPFMETLRARLAPGGAVAVATPNINSPIRYALGTRWPSFKSPEHVTYYNQATLQDLLRRAGFNEVTSVPFPHAFPLSLIAGKFNLRLPAALGRQIIWLPTTMVAAYGRG